MRLHTISLGCQMSAADASEMQRPLARRGFSSSEDPEQADAILINTCTVRQHAEDRAVSLIGSLREWKEKRPDRVLIVAGCAAERLGEWLHQRFPHVDLVVGSKSIEEFPKLVEEALGRRFDALEENRRAFREVCQEPPQNGASAFLTIMRGCNYSCSYCIVPFVRGRELYREPATILTEAAEHVSRGARELILLGQTVNSYRSHFVGKEVRFAELLRLVDRTESLERVRFMSPHPFYVDDAMVSAMAECRTGCSSLHLPIQSGSDRMLKLMRRNYTRASYLDKVERARRSIPDLTISTDIIVGFPTESEEDFERTLELIEELRPISAYTFKYSPRQGTESSRWPDDVPTAVKEDRLERLNALVERMSAQALGARVGRTAEVLCEEPLSGRTRDGFRVRWKDPQAVGRTVLVRIASATTRSLIGEIA
ncbi:MAG: tRNA (N6-isopentenyl adenosine(37)-C2)-methylthiotransferase MiaB [Elusimicrobia bacterium]|nr:tRNA (N6-isopentenyl adenosine(37)-C2)-methylthiotransferase MiaB [Elusimicrobiota bacterium]